MNAAQLIGSAVHDRHGELLGHVHDLRFQPADDGGCEGWQLTGLACGEAQAIGHRLGYSHRDMAGPWPLSWWLRRRSSRDLLIEWADVVHLEGRSIEIRPTRDELQRRRSGENA